MPEDSPAAQNSETRPRRVLVVEDEALVRLLVVQILEEAGYETREAAEAKRQEVAARIAGIDAALAQLESLEGAGASPAAVEAIKRRHGDRRAAP